jgi:hypothetical protein
MYVLTDIAYHKPLCAQPDALCCHIEAIVLAEPHQTQHNINHTLHSAIAAHLIIS